MSIVDSILRQMLNWLGAEFGTEMFCLHLDYFRADVRGSCKTYQEGQGICMMTLSADEIREYRGTLTEPGKESPYRNRSVEENLDLFEKNEEMVNLLTVKKVLRAKIDMASPNINMRDPVIYRVAHLTHHRTGDDWCIYPMYDFAHPT